MKKDIIFYSNFCTYCKEIINQISKTPINDNILYVCVDDENIQLPNFIKAVPTIYLVSQKRIVVDDAIPKWIEEKLSTSESNGNDELQAYFGQCDSSFGSSFSSLDNSEQKPYVSSSFTFIGDEQKITTPEESSSNNNNSMQNNSFMKDSLTNDYEKLQNSRNNDFQPINRR
tara:strand:- start:127 stop:642 length:516 start_codon:yes stop_codon:yes gene_type:complete